MPKQKTHSGTKKRFWLTGTGKVNRAHGGKNHKAETKNSKSVNALKKRRKIFKLSKGYFGNKSKSYRIARQAVMKSLNYAYIGRRRRKRDFRKLWIARINAAARINGLSYSKLMHGLNVAGINLNRKVLADLAVNDAPAFAQLAEKAKAAL